MLVGVDGIDIFTKDQGAGAPILFLHGNPDTSDIWDQVILLLRGKYRCIAPDLPGFGRSAGPGHFDYSFESLGMFVDRLVDALDVDLPLDLVTHDFGGAFGMAWAIQRPDKVRFLVVINHPFFIAGYHWHVWARLWRAPLLGELSLRLMNWPAFYRIVRRGSRRLDLETIRRAYAFITPQWKRMVLRLYRAADPAAFRPWEARMLQLTARVPAMVLWGAQDPWVPHWVAGRFGAQKVVDFPESGHWTPAEVPDGVAREISHFVS